MPGAAPDDIDQAHLAALLDGARAAALRAGDAILAIAREGPCEVHSKTDASPLTRADLAADAILTEALHALEPHMPVVSEETTCDLTALPRRFWLVDPLDGTREFIAGNGEYTVNIALIEDGLPVLGVVHAPARGVTYSAARGVGAWRTDAKGTCAISACADGPLVVAASRSHSGPSLASFLRTLPPHTLVELGSSLKLCLVADGSAQLYPRLGPTCWWDTAAAHAIVLEAGAQLLTLAGEPLRYGGDSPLNPSFVCTSLPRPIWTAAPDCA
ncbi:MAG: 3'(2'),5'-bisphosphate nucleotidase CysQ [Candidatus Eremiobacteraeota bacterium]|nr:3'(2'),5'-bisphosphate nucleotidase CysQ [Candidatus Eremiobacteraeota bacterium]